VGRYRKLMTEVMSAPNKDSMWERDRSPSQIAIPALTGALCCKCEGFVQCKKSR